MDLYLVGFLSGPQSWTKGLLRERVTNYGTPPRPPLNVFKDPSGAN